MESSSADDARLAAELQKQEMQNAQPEYGQSQVVYAQSAPMHNQVPLTGVVVHSGMLSPLDC